MKFNKKLRLEIDRQINHIQGLMLGCIASMDSYGEELTDEVEQDLWDCFYQYKSQVEMLQDWKSKILEESRVRLLPTSFFKT